MLCSGDEYFIWKGLHHTNKKKKKDNWIIQCRVQVLQLLSTWYYILLIPLITNTYKTVYFKGKRQQGHLQLS